MTGAPVFGHVFVLLTVMAGLVFGACDLPPTRRALTVWAEPPVALDATAWQLTSASCVGGRALGPEQLALSMCAKQPPEGPLELVLQGKRFGCRERLTVALVATQLPRTFVWMEQARTQEGAACAVEHEAPAIVSFSQERRLVVLRGPMLGLCGGLDAELYFAPSEPLAQADKEPGH